MIRTKQKQTNPGGLEQMTAVNRIANARTTVLINAFELRFYVFFWSKNNLEITCQKDVLCSAILVFENFLCVVVTLECRCYSSSLCP